MERNRARYLVLSISDGLFLGLGLSLGVSFFNEYSFTFVSILLVGITGALSNMFSVYNAENFATGLQLMEYKKFMFTRDYNPVKLASSKHMKSLKYAAESFISTITGSIIVIAPYLAFYFSNKNGIRSASIASFIISIAVLGLIGSYSQHGSIARLKAALKTAGIGVVIAALSASVGFVLSSLV